MSTASIIDRIGPTTIAQAVGVKVNAVYNTRGGNFPAAWYPTIQRLAKERSIPVSPDLFHWRQPKDAVALDTMQETLSASLAALEAGNA